MPTKIHEGCADRTTCFALLNRPASERKPGDWWEITEDDYWYFLEVLPPLAMTGGSFSMSEFTDGDMTHSFHKITGFSDPRRYARYFAVLIRSSEFNQSAAFKALAAARADLLAATHDG